MSLISKFKSLLPVSSRSFHAAEKHFVTQNNLVKDELFDIKSKQDELFRRIEQTDNGINMNLNYKVGEVLSPTLKSISDDLDAHDSHMKMFAWDAYKNEGESIDDAKKRFFDPFLKRQGECAYFSSDAQSYSRNSTLFARKTAFLIG